VRTAHIIYCESRVLLDKQPYGTWRELQDAYSDYKASLGPWEEADIIAFLTDDLGADDARWPFTRHAIHAFFNSDDRVLAGK
jgi:hypothetical protein